jgi:hypothetical protein
LGGGDLLLAVQSAANVVQSPLRCLDRANGFTPQAGWIAGSKLADYTDSGSFGTGLRAAAAGPSSRTASCAERAAWRNASRLRRSCLRLRRF